jgi:Mrp family chromosome partitioning ATPase/capsular polysaccharide biosynthesis protein
MDSSPPDRMDVREALTPVLVRKWWILAFTLLCGVALYLYFARQPDEYRASTSILVQTSNVDEVLFGANAAQSSDRVTNNQALLLRTRPVADAVAERLLFPASPDALLGALAVSPAKNADFVGLTVTWGEPRQAAQIANAFAQSFIQIRSRAVRGSVLAARDVAEQTLSGLADTRRNASARRELQERIQRLDVIASLPSGSAEQVDPASPPGAPSAPKPLRNAIFGGLLALLAAIGVAFLRDRMDRRIKSVDDVRRVYCAPLLSVLPHSKDTLAAENGHPSLPPDLTEAVRLLRTNLDLIRREEDVRRIVVTSAVPSEGKTTVTRSLALAFHESGCRVAVVDADVRRPAGARVFGTESRPGLMEVLTGEVALEDALQHVEVGGQDLTALAKVHAGDNGGAHRAAELSVLASGGAAHNPPALLASGRMRQILRELGESHDIVLIDTPPLLAVSDALPLFDETDAVLIVTRLGQTTTEVAERLVEVLREARVKRLLGVVANDLPAAWADQHGYGYRAYGYAYGKAYAGQT